MGRQRTRRLAPMLAAAGGAIALVGGQAVYTTRRRDLPSVVGLDASGVEGHHGGVPLLIGCAGDSTLTGAGLADPAQVWVRQAARAGLGDHRVEIRSFAVGGSRVTDVVAGQIGALVALAPDVAVIAAGSNDAIRWTPLRGVEHAMQELLGAVCARVPRVLVAGVGDLGAIARVPVPLAAVVGARARQVNRVIQRVAGEFAAVRYLDVAATDPAFRAAGRSLFSPDLFHPNHLGHAVWAAMAAPVLRETATAARPPAALTPR